MSVAHTVLAIDGRPETIGYLAGMGLSLPAGFRSQHPTFDDVRAAVEHMKGWRLGAPDHPGERRFSCDLFRDGLSVTVLMFTASEGPALLAATRGDPCLPLLRELARALGPLVILLNAEEPLLVEAPSA